MAREPIPSPDDERTYPPNEKALRSFYRSQKWLTLSYERKGHFGYQCQCCGVTADDARIVSDHIRPIRYYWHLRLERTNVQVLCEECNLGKASWDKTDYRASVKERALEAIAHYERTDRGAKLKDAITSAYSLGALSEEDAGNLIIRHALEYA